MKGYGRTQRCRALASTCVRAGPVRGVLVVASCVSALLLTGAAARGEAPEAGSAAGDHASLDERTHPLGAWSRARERLAGLGLRPEAVYTLDVLRNAMGGVARKTEVLGNLVLTLTWRPEAWLGRDLGTFLLYGLVNHGGRPSRAVGDGEIVAHRKNKRPFLRRR